MKIILSSGSKQVDTVSHRELAVGIFAYLFIVATELWC